MLMQQPVFGDDTFKRSLTVLDTMGDAPQPLISVSGDWYLPHWSKTNPGH